MLPAFLTLVIALLLFERRRAGQSRKALEENKRFTEQVAETLPSILFVYDLAQNRNVYVNHQSFAVLGYTDDEVLRMGDQFLAKTMHPEDLARLPALATEYVGRKDGEVFEHIFRLRHRNGEWRWIHRCATVFARSSDGTPKQIVGTATDITKLKVVEQELRSLSIRLLNIQDDERRRIARELHDGTAQDLYGLSLSIASLKRRSDLPPEILNTLDECRQICDSSLQEVRTLSYLLHPPTFNQSGLAGALETFVEGFSRRSGIPVELKIANPVDPLLPAVERDLFRVVQEGLANVARHSASDRAIVSMEENADWVSVIVQDFGKGMPEAFADGVGLASMRERLRHLGGRLEIQSGAGGTTLKASVPRRFDQTGESVTPREDSPSVP